MKGLLACALLVTCLGVEAASADRPWRLIRGRNVSIAGQQSPRTLRRIAVEIEQFRMALGAIVPAARQPLPIPTVVYTFDDKKAMEPFVPIYQGRPMSVGGYCHCGSNSDVNFIVANLAAFEDASRLIYHEYTHLIIGNTVRHAPLWLNEGLAEYYSTFHLTGDERRAQIGRPIAHHLAALGERSLPIAEILAVDPSSALYNESDRRSIFYAEVWALTHYLMNARAGGGARITAYLDEVARGEQPETAFRTAFSTSPAEMDRELRAYIQRLTFPVFTFDLPGRVEVDEPEKAVTVMPGEASARLGGIQLRIGRADEAAPRIEAAAAAEPKSAEAQLTLALLRVHQGRSEESLKPLEAAAALAPGDFLTQYSYGLLLLRRQINGEELPTGGLERAHDALTRAVAANPQSSEALAWKAFADLAGRTRLDEAQAAIVRALELSPGRLDFRMRLAEILVARNDEAGGRRLFTELAATKADQDIADHARAALDQLDAAARRRTAAAAATTAARLEIEPPADALPVEAPPAVERGTLRLRTVRAGEERAYGMLTAVECSPTQVRFHLAVGSRIVIATAPRMDDVEVTRFVGDKDDRVMCGPRVPPDAVYLTWRMTKPPAVKAPAGQQTSVVGTAVAVEFVPLGYVP